jgi:hypothetical protein
VRSDAVGEAVIVDERARIQPSPAMSLPLPVKLLPVAMKPVVGLK